MKRFLAILVSAVMIIAMAIPVLASPFSDLPDSHWATDAVKMLSALGIIQGYPDGSFKGRNQATRYEVALMVARALEYLDKDIRNLTERLNQLQGEPAPIAAGQPDPKAGEGGAVVLQAPAPDATILEQVIAEKIAGMSEAQWEEFDDRLSALLARTDDLSESNKAEHAALWKALEALKSGSAGGPGAAGSDEELRAEMELALLQQKAELTMAFYDSIAAANDERDRAIEGLKAEFDQAFLDQQAALMASFYDVLEAYKGDHEIEHAALEAKIEALLGEQAAALDSAFREGLAQLRDEVSLAMLQQKAELTMAFYDSIQALRDEYEQRFQSLGDQWKLALLEQKAELTMAFYDSIQALRDENEQKFAAIEEKWELALLEQKAELTMAFYDSIEALKDEYEQRFASLEEKWELALLEQKAELAMAFSDSIAAERDARTRAMDELAAMNEQDLIDAKAEMAAAIYDALEAVRGEFAIEIDAVMAVIDALRAEYDTELKALGARIDAVDAALNARIDALEAEVAHVRALADQNAFDIVDTYHKLKTEDIAPLTERVDKLEESTAAAHAEIKALRGDFNKVRIGGSNELKFVDIDVEGYEAAYYKDPFSPSDDEVYEPTSKLENTLKLALKLQPREGVNIDIGVKAVTDVFGGPDTLGLFSGDLDAVITTPRDVTKIKAGALDRPGNFTKYQISAAVFEDANARVRGIGADYTRGDLSLTGIIAKLNPLGLDFQYALGAGTQFKLTDKLTLGARVLQISNDNLSGGVPGSDPQEIAFGGDFALELSDALSVTGEVSLWKNSDMDKYLVAHNLGAQGKLGFLNITASHEQVEEGYDPGFRGTAWWSDPDYLKNDARASKLTVETDPIRGFVITGEVAREGDAYYETKDKSTYGAKLAYNTKLLAADLTLRSGIKQVDAKLPDDPAVTTAQLGFDVAYKPIEAGFTWERGIESKKVGYIGYAKANIPFGDALTIKGDWEQRFATDEYYKLNAGLALSLPVVPDKVTLGAEASYGKATGWTDADEDVRNDTNYAKWLMKGDVAWQITPATKATSVASYEWREYDAEEKPSGEYLQLGLGIEHKLFDATSLNFKYDLKDILYSATGFNDYTVRVLELSLKTEF